LPDLRGRLDLHQSPAPIRGKAPASASGLTWIKIIPPCDNLTHPVAGCGSGQWRRTQRRSRHAWRLSCRRPVRRARTSVNGARRRTVARPGRPARARRGPRDYLKTIPDFAVPRSGGSMAMTPRATSHQKIGYVLLKKPHRPPTFRARGCLFISHLASAFPAFAGRDDHCQGGW